MTKIKHLLKTLVNKCICLKDGHYWGVPCQIQDSIWNAGYVVFCDRCDKMLRVYKDIGWRDDQELKFVSNIATGSFGVSWTRWTVKGLLKHFAPNQTKE